ncbi:uroporphyrin methyltransferase [Schizosaccharomyces cryophilus OY26]|uniref:uroporphyrinogen-III C-methyltransferase n=1 Tax=Schizosaccharomyces cryophilus (strain OY26 / ATCC MYA-4695 / CBS 11777 / NBRC 106824 / NRRL Y48691) TaxID=653667 RepID=S9XBL7_SCHCR|nr:uroporphyrin methyltransferase [Schizosaccharomyces cryophilus OY26]EPY51201.1 uroporphyrin methyltransferase [Schizosaccharomyces cryophilus OY26]
MLISTSLENAAAIVIGSGKSACKRVDLCLSKGVSKVVWFCGSTSTGGFDLGPFQENKLTIDKVHLVPICSFDPSTSLFTLGNALTSYIIDIVFITDTKFPLNEKIYDLCKRNRIPVNIVDCPSLCSFTLPACWSEPPLQIALSTTSNGCRIAQRLLRHVVSSLPPGIGEAVRRFGVARSSTKNPQKRQWINHVSDFWPLEKLIRMSEEDILSVISDDYMLPLTSSEPSFTGSSRTSMSSQEDLTKEKVSLPLDPNEFPTNKKGSIVLVGSGPGDPELLTIAARNAIQKADYLLADKLVPESVLKLIPRHTPLFIARKFPGNADKAQDELHEIALDALKRGDYVVRLKQGDPYIYGRGGEEVLFFHKHGYVPKVIPGISSALMAPVSAGIPITQRGVADQFLVCTGTSQKGAMPVIPPFVASQTAVFLMALHRLDILVDALLQNGWPKDLPVCIAERVSCPDQRFIFSTLEMVVEVYNTYESLPPGLLITGYSCQALSEVPLVSRFSH